MCRMIIHQYRMYCESLFLFGFVYTMLIRFIFHREYPVRETKYFLNVSLFFLSFCDHILLIILFVLNPTFLFFIKE